MDLGREVQEWGVEGCIVSVGHLQGGEGLASPKPYGRPGILWYPSWLWQNQASVIDSSASAVDVLSSQRVSSEVVLLLPSTQGLPCL